MLFWIKIAALFLIRSKRTSIVLAAMVFIAVSSLIFMASLAVGVNDAMIKNSVGLYSGHISGYDIPGDIEKKDLWAPGIFNVLKRIHFTGFFSHNDKTEMISLIGVEPLQEKKTSAFWKKTIKGRFLENDKNEIFISETTSKRVGALPGDIVYFTGKHSAVPQALIVSGIYKTGIDQFDNGACFCTLNALVERNKNDSWSAALFLKEGADMDLVLGRYKQHPGLKHVKFRTWKQMMPDLEQLISLNYFSMNIVIVMVFIIVSLGITCAFSIFILKSIREYGIMKVMGTTPGETIFLLVCEVCLINFFASAVGLLIGCIAVYWFQWTGVDLTPYTSHNQYFIVSGVVYPRLTPYSLCLPPLSALLFSVPAALWPAVMIIRKNAVDILRSR